MPWPLDDRRFVSPGQGGIAKQTNSSGSTPVHRYWNAVPTGMSMDTPLRRAVSGLGRCAGSPVGPSSPVLLACAAPLQPAERRPSLGPCNVARVNDHQVRVLGRIADVIDQHWSGSSSRTQMFNDVWGLITAAELKGSARTEIQELYFEASLACDASEPWMPAEHRTTDDEAEAAIGRLRSWASAHRDGQEVDGGG